MAAQIRIRNATKVFRAHGREVEALRDITFDVPAGEFVCLLGPSGCGKSTLLNAVAGFSPPLRDRWKWTAGRSTDPGRTGGWSSRSTPSSPG